jgi:hypothetical protein
MLQLLLGVGQCSVQHQMSLIIRLCNVSRSIGLEYLRCAASVILPPLTTAPAWQLCCLKTASKTLLLLLLARLVSLFLYLLVMALLRAALKRSALP